jgi:hypothetical protein
LAHFETDYLVVGSGAVGMAFADTLIHESQATCMIVDRHQGPGGHWNDAYPFVRLHQPSAYYGVNSRPLGTNTKDTVGLNKGMYERASAAELMSYYEQVMQALLATGRVQYFPMTEYNGCTNSVGNIHEFSSLLSGQKQTVQVKNKWVDTSYLKTQVPSTHKPKYTIASGLNCITPNDLQRIGTKPSEFVVVGSGKTGIDACIWLLENGVNPDLIRWVIPRDAWYLNRENVQPGTEFFSQSFGGFTTQLEVVAQAKNSTDLFHRLEAAGQLLRLDPNIEPQMYHGAICSASEIQLLRRIKGTVRKGRILSIEPDQIKFENGVLPSTPDCLYVDCSASAVALRPIVPVFEGNKITPQFIRTVQPTFSAAMIAYIEINYPSEVEKNDICSVVPLPDKPIDWLKMLACNTRNQKRWAKETALRSWILKSRLDAFTALPASVDPKDAQKMAILQRYSAAVMPAVANMQALLAQHASQSN